MTTHLNFDKNLQITKPYPGEAQGAFVLQSSQMEMVLLRSTNAHELLGEVWFDVTTAGPPGHVHGGCQAAILDEMMGATGWHHGFAVVAAKIEVEFLQMVPVQRQYSVRGQILRNENRKVYIQAELFKGEQIFARSNGLFVSLTPEQMKSLADKQRGN